MGAIVALVTTPLAANLAEAGIMIRAGLAANAAQVFLALVPSNGVRLDYRNTANPSSAEINPNTGNQTSYWVKLVRIGSSVTGYISPDGNVWTQVGSAIALGAGSMYVGLAVTARNNDNLTTGNFQHVSLVTDATSPTILAANLGTTPGSQITFQFSQDVSASLSASDLQLSALVGSVSDAANSVSFNSTNDTATFILASPLSPGIYTASLSAANISNSIGTHLSTNYMFSFLFAAAGTSLSLPGSGQTFSIQQLSLAPSAQLDLGQDTLLVQYPAGNSPAAAIASLITTGFANGQWNGPGIISTAAASDSTFTTAVGSFDNGSQITIAHTWYGDANVDGVINTDDLSLMMLGQTQSGTRWQDGDFLYHNQVNADDWMKFAYALAYSNGQNLSIFNSNNSTQAIDSASSIVAPSVIHNPLPTFAEMPIAFDKYLNDLLNPSQSILL